MDAPIINIGHELGGLSMIIQCFKYTYENCEDEQIKKSILKHHKRIAQQIEANHYAVAMVEAMKKEAAKKQCAGISKLNKRK